MRMARSKDADRDGIKSASIIAEVAKRPVLYDANHQAYGERALKAQCWEEVCAAVLQHWPAMGASERHASGKEIQKRWRSIRDSYTKAYRQGKCIAPGGGGGGGPVVGGGRRSQHQRQMAFLYHALQRKVPRVSTDKRVPDLEAANSPTPCDIPLNIIKLENIEELPPVATAKTYHNKKRSDTRMPSIDNSTSTDADTPLEYTRESLETKAQDPTKADTQNQCSVKDASTETVQEYRNGADMRTSYADMLNPSLEIKIDANAVLPEDHFEDDRLFMNSLLPFFKKMDDGTRLTCRIEVLRIIKDALQGKCFEGRRQPEEVIVKEEMKASSDVNANGGDVAVQQNRFGRKRKSVTPFQLVERCGGHHDSAPKRRGPGRPRKNSPPQWEELKAASESEEEAALRRRRRRAAGGGRPGSRVGGGSGGGERDWESRLTPDEEEMYRATSVAQLKPPQFLKMYNLEPAKKPAASPAPLTPDPTPRKEAS